MRRYTNNNGELVEVSQEHLDMAVEIYDELRKLSSSGKISWRKHNNMMSDSGFDDSDVNEGYRQIIKSERKKQGKLPSIETYAELVSEKQKNALEKEVGHLAIATQDMRDEAARWRLAKRTIARDVIVMDSIERGLRNAVVKANELPKYEEINMYGDTMLITLNDIHYGYTHPDYTNPKEIEEVIAQYADRVISIGKREQVKTIIVANNGDSIEGVLRNQSLIDSEMSSVEQMIGVTEIINGFLEKLSTYFMVEYLALAGNHERLVANYKEAIDGESYIPINIGMVKKYFENSERVFVIDTDSIYHHILNVNGYNVFLCHGDRHKVQDKSLLYKLSVHHNVIIDILVAGHFHSHSIEEVGDRKYQIITGSIKGIDAFSEKINAKSGRSQVAIIFNDDAFDIRQVLLS